MNIHEYQGKEILRKYGVSVPNGKVLLQLKKLSKQQKNLERQFVLLKHKSMLADAGKLAVLKLPKILMKFVHMQMKFLGKTLVTHQTGPEGKEVKRFLIEEGCDIKKEYYVGLVLDRATSRVVLMASEEGGTEIEEVAEKTPEKIFKEVIDPVVDLMPYQARRIAFNINIPHDLVGSSC